MPRNTRVLVVSGFDHNSSTTRLELFFKNKSKSGGGPIQHVQMNKMNSKLAVQFKDESSKNYMCIIISTNESVDTMDLTRLRRVHRRRSV